MNRSMLYMLLFLALAALLVRGAVLWIAPIYSLPYDHHEYVRWSIQTAEDGLGSVYVKPPRESKLFFWDKKRAELLAHTESLVCNYPPLGLMLFDVQGRALAMFDADRVSNTRAARLIFGLLPIVGDIVCALGVWWIVRRLASERAALLAYAVVLFAPPLVIDCAFWGQTDSWFLAPAVWMIAAMMRRRWFAAGLLWGVALALKTQGVLLAPVWLMALLWSPQRSRVVAGGALGLLVLFITALPFTFASGFAWFDRAYRENVATNFNKTTLKAFNIWYVDVLLSEDDDASKTLGGVSKDVWGKALLAIGLLAAAVGTKLRTRDLSWRLLLFTGVLLLLVVTLPTRVHERYVVMCIPFLIALAACRPRLWIGVAPLLVGATFQLLVFQWVGGHPAAGRWPEALAAHLEAYHVGVEQTPEQYRNQLPPPGAIPGLAWEDYMKKRRPLVAREWTLTVFMLAATLLTVILVFFTRSPAAADDESASDAGPDPLTPPLRKL